MKYYNKIAEESRKNFPQFSYYLFYKKIRIFRAEFFRFRPLSESGFSGLKD